METKTVTADRVVSNDPGQVRESLGGFHEEMKEGLGGLLDKRGKGGRSRREQRDSVVVCVEEDVRGKQVE
jgi:hypothetical protein